MIITISVIIVAAGNSSRMNGVNKQLEKIGDTPVFVMSALKFERSKRVGEIIIAAPADEVSRYEKLARNFGVTKLSAVVAGGDTRANSVRNALNTVSPKADYIAIHDGARPLIETEEIERVFVDAEKYNAAIAAVPAVDTVKFISCDGFVDGSSPLRESFYYAQTPQVFKKELYLSCLKKLGREVDQVTDDSSILERCGVRVGITVINCCNMKITHPDDLIIASMIYSKKKR
ncbi:MAG: 2-C-methyl-D-erythritol 4-phosphate cytidylyltransferase [Ruminococcaceae bacterium]|nr:2-C-methyl-D-erythritol 4-phosphate cytidylyltransferase [Oscillospiraceae bacterium]